MLLKLIFSRFFHKQHRSKTYLCSITKHVAAFYHNLRNIGMKTQPALRLMTNT